jgi:UDP-N-acetylglucosamine transferase subunit ALG13
MVQLMTWEEMRHMAQQRVDRLWVEYQRAGRGEPPQEVITELAAEFVTREKVEELWRDDSEVVCQHAEENGVEDALEDPLSEVFYEEVGEAVLDQVGGEMLMRYVTRKCVTAGVARVFRVI